MRVLHWPWTTGSGTQPPPSPQASSPKQAMQLLPWCTGSGSQTNVNLLWEDDNLPQAIPRTSSYNVLKIFLVDSSFLQHWEGGKQRPHWTLLSPFPFFLSHTKDPKGAPHFLSALGREFPYVISFAFLRWCSFCPLFRGHSHGWMQEINGFVNGVRYTGGHEICKASQPQGDREYKRGATLLEKMAYSACAVLNLSLSISHPDWDNTTEFGDIDLEFRNKIVLKI